MNSWEQTREQFRRLAARQGFATMAKKIPADRATLYRLLTGKTGKPTKAIRAGIERLLQAAKD